MTKTKLLSLVLQTTFLDSKRWLTMIISKMFLVLQECRKQRLFYETLFFYSLQCRTVIFHQQIIETKKYYFIHILTKEGSYNSYTSWVKGWSIANME